MSGSSIGHRESPDTLKYSQVTSGIVITAQPFPLPNESDPEKGKFAFGYKIQIENVQDRAVQLLERHWMIYSAENMVAEVVGPGVVGEQPVIEPGQTFSYQSAAVITEPVGSMVGSYTMRYLDSPRNDTGTTEKSGRRRVLRRRKKALEPVSSKDLYITVAIPRFSLVFPMQFH